MLCSRNCSSSEGFSRDKEELNSTGQSAALWHTASLVAVVEYSPMSVLALAIACGAGKNSGELCGANTLPWNWSSPLFVLLVPEGLTLNGGCAYVAAPQQVMTEYMRRGDSYSACGWCYVASFLRAEEAVTILRELLAEKGWPAFGQPCLQEILGASIWSDVLHFDHERHSRYWLQYLASGNTMGHKGIAKMTKLLKVSGWVCSGL
jgi:hypothetical protein